MTCPTIFPLPQSQRASIADAFGKNVVASSPGRKTCRAGIGLVHEAMPWAVDVLYIFVFLMHHLSPCPFLWLQIHQHWHQKLSKKCQTSLQNKKNLWHISLCQKKIKEYCCARCWLGWVGPSPGLPCEHGFRRIAALALLGCWCHFVCSRLTLPWLHAHAKPNVACRQMCAAVCFFLTTGGKPVWGSIFDWIKKTCSYSDIDLTIFNHKHKHLRSIILPIQFCLAKN